ncbi:MAG: ABC transporter ATP-binding protein [Phycisphaeraceae bacterium]|nr:ABC transporter ATP-binding protein [Phycisphaeraceae bacterium]
MADSPSKHVIVVQKLVKVFRDFWLRPRARAVDDVTFEVHPGEVFGLLGPNGSGKSTTIKVILGLLHKTSGRVAVFGKPPDDVAVKRRIGYLPEESYLYPFLNARETLEYYAKLFELDRSIRNRRVDELLDMVGLAAVQFRPVSEYSKGMQRRIGIAQALINDPQLLILDEPTTGLDPIGNRQIKDLIIELGRRGKTVLLSSHLLADVEDCVNRMVILYGGKIREEGTCESLLTADDKTVLEFDSLNESLISEIDSLVRQRTAGQRSIERVSKPRQRLEDLFMDIVQRALAERVATAGAQHGGQTASFLRTEEPAQASGEALIDQLVNVAPEPALQAGRPSAEKSGSKQDGPDDAVLASLIGTPPPAAKPPTPPRPAGSTPAPSPSPDVDLGVIGDLMGGDTGGTKHGDPKPPERRP